MIVLDKGVFYTTSLEFQLLIGFHEKAALITKHSGSIISGPGISVGINFIDR